MTSIPTTKSVKIILVTNIAVSSIGILCGIIAMSPMYHSSTPLVPSIIQFGLLGAWIWFAVHGYKTFLALRRLAQVRQTEMLGGTVT